MKMDNSVHQPSLTSADSSPQTPPDDDSITFDSTTIATLMKVAASSVPSAEIIDMVAEMVRQGNISSEDVVDALQTLPSELQATYFRVGMPWMLRLGSSFSDGQLAEILTDALSAGRSPYGGRIMTTTVMWDRYPDFMTDPEDVVDDDGVEPDMTALEQLTQRTDPSVYEIGDDPEGDADDAPITSGSDTSTSATTSGSGRSPATGGERRPSRPEPRPADSAPIKERLKWLETEARRKKRHLDDLLERLELGRVLMSFFFGSSAGGVAGRAAALDRFDRTTRAGLQTPFGRKVLDEFMKKLRRGDTKAVSQMLSRYGFLRRKVLAFLLKRFHLIGAILGVASLVPILELWREAHRCRAELDRLDDLRWRWMHEGGLSITPHDGPTTFGPFVDPSQLGLPDGSRCEHSVTYIFQWTDTSGEVHEEVLAGPRKLEKPGATADRAGMPRGALTDSHSLPTPSIPPTFSKGYVIYEFVTTCTGREPIVSRLFAVAVHGAPTSSGGSTAPTTSASSSGTASSTSGGSSSSTAPGSQD